LERASEPQVYLSWQQTDNVSTWYAPKDLVVRASGDPLALVAPLRRIIHEADPEVPISEERPLTAIVAGETETRRVQLSVLGAFGVVAFLLAAVGIHSLLSFAVAQRTQEIGVRIALGARARNIIAMTVREALILSIAGIGIGLVVAFVEGRWLESLLAGVTTHDALTFTAAATLGLVMTLAGSLLPVIRALRVDPTTAIRTE
jgi:putative ABC transport system permease protein